MPNHLSSPHLLIHKQVWHYRLFCWSLGIVDAWRGGHDRYEENFEFGTSLFHYLRVILVYAPLAILSNIALVVWIIFSLFVIPVEVGGVWQYLGFWLLLILLGTITTFAWWLLMGWASSRTPHRKGMRHSPRLTDMAKRYIRSRRDKVRPLITFVEERE